MAGNENWLWHRNVSVIIETSAKRRINGNNNENVNEIIMKEINEKKKSNMKISIMWYRQ
jgi:hypothetical protein